MSACAALCMYPDEEKRRGRPAEPVAMASRAAVLPRNALLSLRRV